MPILDSRKSLADYIFQVALEALPSWMYYNNGTKAAKIGGGFSSLQLIYLSIVHKLLFCQVIPDKRLM